MRWNDAEHVDRMTLLARRPVLGWCYAALGIVLSLALPVVASWHLGVLLAIIGLAGVLWFVAWYQVVGRLWRQPLVIAMALGSVLWWLSHHGVS